MEIKSRRRGNSLASRSASSRKYSACPTWNCEGTRALSIWPMKSSVSDVSDRADRRWERISSAVTVLAGAHKTRPTTESRKVICVP